MDATKHEFGMKLLGFYKEFLCGSAKAIELLAEIQTAYPKEYDILVQMKNDPTMIEQFTESLSTEEKDLLLLAMIKASQLGSKMNNLFELSANDKRVLISEINKYSSWLGISLKQLVERKSITKSE